MPLEFTVMKCPHCPHMLSAHTRGVCGVCECGSGVQWSIERCERETKHAQVFNSHFCRCTHVMFDSEKPNAAPMHAAKSMTEDERQRRSQFENQRRWRKRAEAERDALEQNVQDAYAALEQVHGVNLQQSLVGAIFDIVQRNRRLRESLDAVVRCAFEGESDECLICDADYEHRHTEDCPILAAERLLEETTLTKSNPD